MERLSYSLKCVVILDLIKRLRDNGSWCGETHVQKAMFIAQDLANANFGYKYIMYKHGPYSFDLTNELAGMRAAKIIDFEFRRAEYGPSIFMTAFGDRIYSLHEEEIQRFKKINGFVADWLSASDVKHLERLATAYFITSKNPRMPVLERAKKINLLKPHVDIISAEEAVRTVDQKKEEAKRQLTIAA